jgi:hypothetical protein
MPASSLPAASADQRAAVRFDTTMPVGVGQERGTVQNVSASGVCFESDARQEVGSTVHVTLEYTLGGERRQLACEGRVVRVEPKGDRVAVAVSFLSPFFDDPEKVEVQAPAAARR